MEITTRLEGDEMHIALNGRLDAAWSNSVNQTLQDTLHGGSHRIALNLSQVSYLSSAGIRVLVLLVKNLKTIGGSLRLVDPSPAVSEVLKLVGFNQLLENSTASVSTPAPVIPAPLPAPSTEARTVSLAGHEFSLYTLSESAIQQGKVIGPQGRVVAVPEDTWAIGHGSLGNECKPDASGELLAVAGLAVSLPGDDPEHPDWMQQEGDLVPEISVLHGLKVSGPFRYLLRFGEIPETPPLRLSELAQAALEACASNTVSWVMIAETAQLIGAALQIPTELAADDFFAFPAVRDHLLFTAEPAYAEETCLVVGVAARNPAMPLATQVRPNSEGGDLFMHAHACVIPFHPVRKGFVDLPESLARLMDAQTIRAVLHLLNDDREGIGAGESYLRRGALWCAPAEFKGEGS
jgi:anti-anti-sigma factor